MRYNLARCKAAVVVFMCLALSACVTAGYEDPTYKRLVGRWQQIYVIDPFGRYSPGDMNIYVLKPDFSAARLCFSILCIEDMNAKWFLSYDSRSITILTNTGTLAGEIVSLTYDRFILRPLGANVSYLYEKISL